MSITASCVQEGSQVDDRTCSPGILDCPVSGAFANRGKPEDRTIANFIFDRSKIESWLRGLIVGGGAVAYLIVPAVLLLMSEAV